MVLFILFPLWVFFPLNYIFDIKILYIFLIVVVKSDFKSKLYILPTLNKLYRFTYKDCFFSKK